MGAIGQHIAAGLFDLGMAPLERRHLRRIRRELLGEASGAVLEVGAGSGVNLGYYRMDKISQLTLSDIEDRKDVYTRRFQTLRRHWGDVAMPELSVVTLDATRLPFDDAVFDTVTATLLFCSVDCPPCGFDEIRRVLKPGGRYLFLEHVRPEHPRLRRTFDLLNPLWNRLAGGCNLNRETLSAIADAGFRIRRHDQAGQGVFVYGEAAR